MKKGNIKRVLAGFLVLLLVTTSFSWDFGETKAAEENAAAEALNDGKVDFDDINVADLDSQGYTSTKFTNGKVVADEIDKAPSEHWFSGEGSDTPYGTSTPESKNIGIKANTASNSDRYFLYTPYSYEDFKVSTEIYYGAYSGIIIGEKNAYPTTDGTASSIAVFFNSGRIHIMGAVDWSTATITRGASAAKSPNGTAKGYAIFNNGNANTIQADKGTVYTLNVMKQGKHLTVWISGGEGVMTIDITDGYKTGWVGIQSRGYHADCGGFKSLEITKINAIESQNFDNVDLQELDDAGYTARTNQNGSSFSKVLDSTASAWASGIDGYGTGTVNHKNEGLKTKFTAGYTTLNTPYVYDNFRLKATVYKGQVLGITMGAKNATPRSSGAISLYINGKYLEVQGAVKFAEATMVGGTEGVGTSSQYHFAPKSNPAAVTGQVCTVVVELKNGVLSFWMEGYDGVARIPVADTYAATENIALFQRQYNVNGSNEGGGFKSYEICNLDAGDAQNFDNVNLSNLDAAGYTATRYNSSSGAVAVAEGAVSSAWFSGESGYAADKTVTAKNVGLKPNTTGTSYLTTLNTPYVYDNFRLKATVYKGQVIGIVIGKEGVAPSVAKTSADEISIYVNGQYLEICGAVQINTAIVGEGGATSNNSNSLYHLIPKKDGKNNGSTEWGQERTVVVEVRNGILSVWQEGYDGVVRMKVADTYTTENIALFQRRYDSNGGGLKSYEIEKLPSSTNIGTTVNLEGYTDFNQVDIETLEAKGFTAEKYNRQTGEKISADGAKISSHWFAGEIGPATKVATSSNIGLKPNVTQAEADGDEKSITILNTPYDYTNFRISTEVYWGANTGIVLGAKNVFPTGDVDSGVRIYFNANQIQLAGGGLDYDSEVVLGSSATWNFGYAPSYIFRPATNFTPRDTAVGEVYKLNVEMKDGTLTIWVDGYDGVLAIKTKNTFKQESIALMATNYDGHGGGLKSLKVEELGDIVMPYTAEQFASYRSGDTYTAPEYKNYLFAGWFTDQACGEESAIATDAKTVETTVYAKFVPRYVLDVKAQVSANLTNGELTDDETGAIRFVTSIDTLNYSQVGFEISYDKRDGNGVQNKTSASNKVYKELFAIIGDTNSETIGYNPKTEFCKTSDFFKACTVKNISADLYDTEFTVTPFWKTMDGTVVNGDAVVKTVDQGIDSKKLKGKTALFIGDSIQAGHNTSDDQAGYTLKGWAQRLERYGLVSENVAQKGWALTNKDISGRSQIVTQLDRATKTDYDFVILEGGVNDVRIDQDTQNPDITIDWGTINEDPNAAFTDDNIAGAMQDLIVKTQDKFPNAKIVYIINHYFGANATNMKNYVAMVKDACRVHDIDYIDLSDTESYPTLEPLTQKSAEYIPDNLHPSAAGYELSTPIIATCLRKLVTGEVADTVYVSATGTDSKGYGTEENPYQSLNYAVNQVADGGTVYVQGELECGPNNSNAYFLGGNKKDIVETNKKQITIKGADDSSLIDFSRAQMLRLNMAVTLENIQVKWSSVRVHAEGNRFTVAETVVQTADSNVPGMYGGSLTHDVSRTELKLYAGSYRPIVGGQTQGTVGETHVTVGGSVNSGVDTSSHAVKMGDGAQCLFGGSFALVNTNPIVSGDTYVTVESGAKFNYVYGGGGHADNATKGSVVQGKTHVEFAGEAYGLYGGGWYAAVENGTNVVVQDGNVAQVFGGSEEADVTGDVDVQVLGGTVSRRIWGGCYNDEYGTTSYHVNGNTAVTVGKGATIINIWHGFCASSRTTLEKAGEKGMMIFLDDTANSLSRKISNSGESNVSYHYLVNAGTNGKVYAAGNSIKVVPNDGYTAVVTSDGTALEQNADGSYTLPALDTATKTIDVTFTAN